MGMGCIVQPNRMQLNILNTEIVSCRKCPRLRNHCEQVASVKRRAYRDQQYWGQPVPAFGDPEARILILGLAPGAHGSNRTGRMFTGDKSGDFLYRALYENGLASSPASVHRDDGLTLRDVFITASARCAPPDNKPTPEEIRNCRPFLERELELLQNVRVVVALGKIAFDTYLDILKSRGVIASRAPFVFGHNRAHQVGPGQPLLISSYHPSQQNTSTGKLTQKMLREVFRDARKAAATPAESVRGRAPEPARRSSPGPRAARPRPSAESR
jgi:uracil-DNA glycosylase family 4